MTLYPPWVAPSIISTNKAELDTYSAQVDVLLGFPSPYGTSYGTVEAHPRNGEVGWTDLYRFRPVVLNAHDPGIIAHIQAHGVAPDAKLWELIAPPPGTMKVWNPLDQTDPTNDCFWVGEGGDGTYDDWV